MSILLPSELHLLEKNGVFNTEKVSKMSEIEIHRLVNHYVENYRILRTEYLDKNALYIKLMQELKSNAPLSREKHVSPSLYRAMQVTERSDDETLHALPPLGKLAHIYKEAKRAFVDQPKLEANIELLMETATERVWKQEDKKIKKEYGEREQKAWWEKD